MSEKIFYYMHESSWIPYQIYDLGTTLAEVKENFQKQNKLTDEQMNEYDIWESTKKSQNQTVKSNTNELSINFL